VRRVDVLVVGGGAAGLSAALLLGRALRTTLVCDAGQPRNARARAVHGFLTRDGIPPEELRKASRAELARYETVTLFDGRVSDVRADGDGFVFTLEGGEGGRARRVLLATGVVDALPAVAGFDELYGTSVFHCPMCDGWELRGGALAVLGSGEHAAGLARELKAWSADVVLLGTVAPADREPLAAEGIVIREDPVRRLEGAGGKLSRVVFEGGSALERDALFFCTGHRQGSDLAARLGCPLDDKGAVATVDATRTCVPGVHVAGDASKQSHLLVVAAAEGALAAVAIHHELSEEDRALVRPSPSPR
jgi:thioredoxin reductase